MADVTALLADVVSPEHVLTGDEISDDYGHDEALTATPLAVLPFRKLQFRPA